MLVRLTVVWSRIVSSAAVPLSCARATTTSKSSPTSVFCIFITTAGQLFPRWLLIHKHASTLPIALREPSYISPTHPKHAVDAPKLHELLPPLQEPSSETKGRRPRLPSSQARLLQRSFDTSISLRRRIFVQAVQSRTVRRPEDPVRQQCVPRHRDEDTTLLEA